jgi:hypothetical protein
MRCRETTVRGFVAFARAIVTLLPHFAHNDEARIV